MSGTPGGRQLVALLGAYLRMSLRGKSAGTFFVGRRAKWRGTLTLVGIYATVGGIAAFGASGSRSGFSFALVLHTVSFIMLGMSLAAESGDLLFNAREHDVLGHRPVADRIVLTAKAGSLLGFALLLALAINLPGLFLARRIPELAASFPAVHLGTTVLLAVFVTATVIFTYGLVVRFVGRERFDSVAAWSQAGLSGAFLALSQGLAHAVELPILGLESPLCLFFPPAWFAALDVLGTAPYRPRAAALALLAVITTIGLATLALGRLARAYGGAFARLSEAQPLAARVSEESSAMPRVARWWLRDPVERAGFRLAATYLRRDREIRTRLYPALGLFVLLPIAQLLGHAAYRFTAAALVAVVLLGMLPSLALEALRVSSQHAATELFAVVPLTSAGPLFQGVRKAVVCYVLAPATLVALAWIALLAPVAFPLALPSLLTLPALSLMPAAFRDYVPLSTPPEMGRQSTANIVIGVLITAIGTATLVLGVVTWRTGHLAYLLAGELLLVVLACRLLARRIDNRPLRVAP